MTRSVKKLFLGVAYTVQKDEEGLWETYFDDDNALVEPGWAISGCPKRYIAIGATECLIDKRVPVREGERSE